MSEGNLNRELIERLKDGEKEAFDELYWKYHSAIYFNILKLTRDVIVTEDIVQEVFITLWEKRDCLDVMQGISGWLFTISYNKTISFLKQKLKDSLFQSKFQQYDDAAEVEDDSLNTRIIILAKAIEQLSPQKRKVFELCKLQRKTYAEAADELQISKYTVKEYLSGAVIFIKKYIKQYPECNAIFFSGFLF